MGFKMVYLYETDVDTVFRMYTSREYNQEKYEALGARNIRFLELAEKDGRIVMQTQREVPSNPPGFAKKFIKEMNTAVQTDTWKIGPDPVKKGTFDVDIKGTPIKIQGTITLEPAAQGCQTVVDCEVKVNIPLIGGKIAQFVEGDVKKNVDEDHRFTKGYLARMT